MKITPTMLRKDIYKLLDKVINTGIPIEISRNGSILKIVLEKKSKLANLKDRRKVMNCDPEEFVHIDWMKEIDYNDHLS